MVSRDLALVEFECGPCGAISPPSAVARLSLKEVLKALVECLRANIPGAWGGPSSKETADAAGVERVREQKAGWTGASAP